MLTLKKTPDELGEMVDAIAYGLRGVRLRRLPGVGSVRVLQFLGNTYRDARDLLSERLVSLAVRLRPLQRRSAVGSGCESKLAYVCDLADLDRGA